MTESKIQKKSYCEHDKEYCDGNSLICRLNPVDTEPYYITDLGKKVPFKNNKCAAFHKEEKE